MNPIRTIVLALVIAIPVQPGSAQAILDQRPAADVPADMQPAKTILFVGNSFTFGALSPVWKYRADTVTDLNGDGVGGVPALFKLFTSQLGLNYDVYLETSPGRSVQWHWDNKAALLDRQWDHVALQDYSTLNPEKPGDPAELIRYAKKFSAMFAARNPDVDLSLTATWSRPDLTYLPGKPWSGRSIYRMALDVRRGYDRAKQANSGVARINPVGEAFNCAIAAGVADANPYDGISYGQIGLWTFDHYHGSAAGYYLEALTLLGAITGSDPRRLGTSELAAGELGISSETAAKLQTAAWRTLHRQACDAPIERLD